MYDDGFCLLLLGTLKTRRECRTKAGRGMCDDGNICRLSSRQMHAGCGGRSSKRKAAYISWTLVCAALLLASARPVGCDGESGEAQIFQWPGTQQTGMGCLSHSDCEAGLFCNVEPPPEHECKTPMGWKVLVATPSLSVQSTLVARRAHVHSFLSMLLLSHFVPLHSLGFF